MRRRNRSISSAAFFLFFTVWTAAPAVQSNHFPGRSAGASLISPVWVGSRRAADSFESLSPNCAVLRQTPAEMKLLSRIREGTQLTATESVYIVSYKYHDKHIKYIRQFPLAKADIRCYHN